MVHAPTVRSLCESERAGAAGAARHWQWIRGCVLLRSAAWHRITNWSISGSAKHLCRFYSHNLPPPARSYLKYARIKAKIGRFQRGEASASRQRRGEIVEYRKLISDPHCSGGCFRVWGNTACDCSVQDCLILLVVLTLPLPSVDPVSRHELSKPTRSSISTISDQQSTITAQSHQRRSVAADHSNSPKQNAVAHLAESVDVSTIRHARIRQTSCGRWGETPRDDGWRVDELEVQAEDDID
ncbi:hypothetical protein B0H11DRAFT_1904470 [Mycena galericulata]|nr:hypothetical protein B0H11DRAFT_1904470 [Mycena galericulata]